jgi:hypothetical protein
METIASYCFHYCENLSTVTFEAGCKISMLGADTFDNCPSLESICIAASIEMISPTCFSRCPKLARIVLETGSKLSTDCLLMLQSQYAVPVH